MQVYTVQYAQFIYLLVDVVLGATKCSTLPGTKAGINNFSCESGWQCFRTACRSEGVSRFSVDIWTDSYF